MAAGIEVRHAKACRSLGGGGCNCQPSYRAHVWSDRDGKRIRRTFPSMAAARNWRQDAQVALRRGTLRAPTATTVAQASEAWLDAARAGEIRNRSGDPYKPSAVRSYAQSLRLRVLPEMGDRRFCQVRRVDLQDLADRLAAQGLSASTVQCALLPLRAMYRRALARGEIDVNPTIGLELPAIRGGRDRFASPQEAAQLLAVLPSGDIALWATAMYAGLRRGELMALRWQHVDLRTDVIRVERSWDMVEGEIGPKTAQGRRTVPIAKALRAPLLDHKMRQAPARYVFGRGSRPFDPGKLTKRADAAWKAAGLHRITLHECRHTFASLMIAAGVNGKALSTYMGHANISITLDRYGHLMPGNETEAAGLLDRYLDAAAAATIGR